MNTPVLYSFRRCPYAMRARLAIAVANINVELREVVLRNKPQQLLQLSAKATVPVLQVHSQLILDESYDIMCWALAQNDPQQWLNTEHETRYQELISENDGEFKYYLDRYKYADRYPEHSQIFYRQQAERFIARLEMQLEHHVYLFGATMSIADAAIFPFIRQFAHVDLTWFESAPYPAVISWLENLLDSALFLSIMQKYQPWQEGDTAIYFPEQNTRQISYQ